MGPKEFELGTAQFVALLLGIQLGHLGDSGGWDGLGSIAHWLQGLTYVFVPEIQGFQIYIDHFHKILGVVGSLATGAVVADTCEALRRNAMPSRVDRIPEANCTSLHFETWLVRWLLRAIENSR